jgi:hypothetical protein
MELYARFARRYQTQSPDTTLATGLVKDAATAAAFGPLELKKLR